MHKGLGGGGGGSGHSEDLEARSKLPAEVRVSFVTTQPLRASVSQHGQSREGLCGMLPEGQGWLSGLGGSHLFVSPLLPPQDLREVGPCILSPPTPRLAPSCGPVSHSGPPALPARWPAVAR